MLLTPCPLIQNQFPTLLQRFVVSETSDCLDPSESIEKYSISRTHFNMNKFRKPDEEDFQMVREVLEKMAKKGRK
jgi:hypothetical protein